MEWVTFAQANICKISSLSSKFLGFIFIFDPRINPKNLEAGLHATIQKMRKCTLLQSGDVIIELKTHQHVAAHAEFTFTIFKLDLCDQQQSTLPYSSSV